VKRQRSDAFAAVRVRGGHGDGYPHERRNLPPQKFGEKIPHHHRKFHSQSLRPLRDERLYQALIAIPERAGHAVRDNRRREGCAEGCGWRRVMSHLYDALGQDRLRRERLGCLREVAAKTLQERPSLIERIANRACLAKLKRQRMLNHHANSSRPTCYGARAEGCSKGPVMQWIAGPVALRWRLDHSEATSATVGSRATVL